MLRPLLAALVAGASLFGATAAQAETRWSIGINLPPVGVVVSDGPRYYAPPAPVYYTPAPVVRYAPAPRYVERDVYYYAPPPRVVYESSWRDRRWDDRGDRWHHHHHGHRHHHGHHHRWDRDEGPRRGH